MRAFYTFLFGLTLAVSPSVGFAPTTVHLRVKSDVGDTIRVLVDDATYSRVTEYPNDGKTREFDWRDVPEGEHTIHVYVFDHGQIIGHTTKRVEYQGRG